MLRRIFDGTFSVKRISFQVRIEERKPTAREFLALSKSVGWDDDYTEERVRNHISAPAFGAVAIDEHSGQTIGSVVVITDHSNFYYVKDLFVQPDWQKRMVGTALMETVNRWIDRHAAPGSLVGLYTEESLEMFYRQFGFSPAFGMVRNV